MKGNVVVLGGGVIGVTTALVFHALGYAVELVSHRFLWEETTDPTFASAYPAASVIPHSVGGDTRSLYQDSFAIYKHIAALHPEVVRPQKHLEISEEKLLFKDYFEWMGAENISEVPAFPVPMRDGVGRVHGVCLDILFVDMPHFSRFLYKRVHESTINITRQEVDQHIFKEIRESGVILCNCLGYNGPLPVGDNSPMEGIAGILVHFPQNKLLKNTATETPISYNYFFEGVEVYAYPRTRDIVFGGIRVPVDALRESATQLVTHFEAQGIGFMHIQTVPVPEYLIEVNKRFTYQLYGVDVALDKAKARIGIRPVRKDGVRIDRSIEGNSMLINNYGYGGAGVTLAWGGAIKVATLVEERAAKGLIQEVLEVF